LRRRISDHAVATSIDRDVFGPASLEAAPVDIERRSWNIGDLASSHHKEPGSSFAWRIARFFNTLL